MESAFSIPSGLKTLDSSTLADLRLLISRTEHRPAFLTGSWIELRTKREGLLEVLDENANFGGRPAAGRPHGKDWHRSLKGSEETDDSTFSEFCREEPRWRLSDTEMFKDTYPQLFNIAGSKDSCGENTLRVLAGAKAPWLH